jgi:hypothetical protein
MKTNMNISNLKKVAFTFFVSLILTSGSYIQANPNANVHDELIAAARLEARMAATEHEVRFVAPAAEPAPEMERLDILAGNTETALQYVAPAVADEESGFDYVNYTETAMANSKI